jgi:hypothetical protein
MSCPYANEHGCVIRTDATTQLRTAVRTGASAREIAVYPEPAGRERTTRRVGCSSANPRKHAKVGTKKGEFARPPAECGTLFGNFDFQSQFDFAKVSILQPHELDVPSTRPFWRSDGRPSTQPAA